MYNDDDFKDEEENESSQSENKILDFYEANKKLIWILGGIIIFILIASLFMGGGNNTPQTPVELDLVISSYNEKLSINNSVQLFASVDGDENAIFNWSSSNPNVATVSNVANNNAVVVTGTSYGTSIITVTYTKDGKLYSEKCEIVVAEGNPNLSITQVSFPNGELMISVGDTYELPIIVTPSEGYKKSVSFVSYNKDIVSVDEDGMIKALKAGKAKVKVTVNNEFTSEINIHVLDKKVLAQIVVNPTKLELLDNLLKIEVGESVELEYDFQPLDTTLSSLVWKSSDETIAKVVNGVVTGEKVGKADITLTSLNGIASIMTVEVVPNTIPVESVQILSETNITLNVGGVSNIVANVTPADATNKKITYSSSNPGIVMVDDNGNIKAVGVGNAKITLTSVDGNKTAIVNVVVNSNSSSGTSSGSSGTTGGSSDTSTIGKLKYRDKNELPAYTSISTALSKQHVGPITVSVNTGVIDKITLCVKKCADNNCVDRTCTEQEVSLPYTINFTEGNGLYVIRSTKYRGNTSEATQANFVNITNATNTSSGNEACYLVGGERKWTTESEALKEDTTSFKLTSYKTQGECEGTSSSKSFSINKETAIYSLNKSFYVTRLRFIGSNIKRVYYCYGSCTVDVSKASKAVLGSANFGSIIGNQTYYLNTPTGKTYYFDINANTTKYFYASGSSSQSVKFKAEYSDGTYSGIARVSLTQPLS